MIVNRFSLDQQREKEEKAKRRRLKGQIKIEGNIFDLFSFPWPFYLAQLAHNMPVNKQGTISTPPMTAGRCTGYHRPPEPPELAELAELAEPQEEGMRRRRKRLKIESLNYSKGLKSLERKEDHFISFLFLDLRSEKVKYSWLFPVNQTLVKAN